MSRCITPSTLGRWDRPARGSATGVLRVRRLAQLGARSCGIPNPAQVLTGAETGVMGLDKTQ